MNERKNLYESLLEQLRRARDICNIVYRYRYVDRLKEFRVAINVGVFRSAGLQDSKKTVLH